MESAVGDVKLKESKEVSANAVTLDDILIKFSLSGRYYVKLLFLLILGCSTNSMYSYNYIFAVEKTEYRCKQSISLCNVSPYNGSEVNDFNPQCYQRVTQDEEHSCAYANNSKVVPCTEWDYKKPDSFVAELFHSKIQILRGNLYGTAIRAQCYQRVTQDEEHSCAYANNSKVVPCTEWDYKKPDSFVAEFQLACQDWKNAFVGTAHCIGYMFGLPFIGSLSDRLGRKKVFITTGVLGGVLGVAKSLAGNYWLYIVFELSEAFFGDLCSACFMLTMEMVATEDRPMFVLFTNMGFIVGHLLVATLAWYFRYWRSFIQVIYAPSLLFIFYIFLLDESPRWLLTKGRKQEAVAVLKKIAETNRTSLEEAVLENLISEDKPERNFGYKTLLKSTFQSKIILKRFLVCVVWWTSGTFINYGVAVNSVLLSGNKYVNFIMIYLLDVPMVIVMAYVLKYFKRKMPLMLSFLAASIFFLMHPFIPARFPWVSLLFFIGGKCMLTIFFGITYVFTSELFPTSTRNSMHALCSSIGRIGSIVAQQTPLLLVYWHGLPSILMAGMALLASLVTLLVPDTADDDLPDTVQEAENIGKNGKHKLNTRL